jgi:hypothetical protein
MNRIWRAFSAWSVLTTQTFDAVVSIANRISSLHKKKRKDQFTQLFIKNNETIMIQYNQEKRLDSQRPYCGSLSEKISNGEFDSILQEELQVNFAFCDRVAH